MISYVIRDKGGCYYMLDGNALKGIIVRNGLNQASMAKMLGITPKTFYLKMKKGVFDSDEIENMINILKIEDPIAVFFVKNVT